MTEDLYTTTDINLAAYLLYHGIEPERVDLNDRNYGILFYKREKTIPVVADFHSSESPYVELRRYNHCRARISKRIQGLKKR